MEKAAEALLSSDYSEKSSDSLIWAASQKFWLHKYNSTKSAVAVYQNL